MPLPAPPRISGRALAAIRLAAETPGTDAAVREILKRSLKFEELDRLPHACRGDLPLDALPLRARTRETAHAPPRDGAAPKLAAWPRTAEAYVAAYRDGKTTPQRIVERALGELSALGSRKPTMNVLASSDRDASLRDATASAKRWQAGVARGPLDGVPFLCKDEFDVAGLATRLGSRCSSDAPAERDSTVVARLRQAGAVFVGKTVMTEWGMSPLGANAAQVMPHNVFDGGRAPGGSSTGSAVGVALGLSPLATAADGGGSIRIPAALNGIFGIKPTFGRVSRTGFGGRASVTHAGPLGASVADLVRFLDAVCSEPDPEDPLTLHAPAPPRGGFGARVGAGVAGLRIGVDDGEWSEASEVVARAGRAALAELEKRGAKLVPIRTSLAQHSARIGYLTMGPEALASKRAEWLERRELIGDDVRLLFAVVSGFTALEQLDAQRLRTGLRREIAAILADVDVIALPTTATTAPRYTEEDAKSTFSDPIALDAMCRFAFLGNLTGLPAGTAPVGADGGGLPIGLQILGDAWDEPGVLGVMSELERLGVAEVKRPPGAIDLLA